MEGDTSSKTSRGDKEEKMQEEIIELDGKQEEEPREESKTREGKVLWVTEERIGIDFEGFGIEIPNDKTHKNLKYGDTIYF